MSSESTVDIGFEISRAFALMDQGKAYASDNNYRDAGEKFQETISVLMAVRTFFYYLMRFLILSNGVFFFRSCPW